MINENNQFSYYFLYIQTDNVVCVNYCYIIKKKKQDNTQLTYAANPAIANADDTNKNIANNIFLHVLSICGSISIVPMYLYTVKIM